MKATVVTSGDLVRAGRWDAGFHEARERLKRREEELSALHSREEIVSLFDKVDVKDVQCLKPLSRRSLSNTESLTRSDVARILVEAPHLALAVFEEGLGAAISRARQKAAEAQDYVSDLYAIRSRIVPDAPDEYMGSPRP